jgi:hypothetical protein
MGKLHGKQQFGRSRRKWEDNINIGLWVDRTGSGLCFTVGFDVNNVEPLDSATTELVT